MDCSPPGPSVHGILQTRILTRLGCHSLQGIFLTQGLNPGLLHCRQILYLLSHFRGERWLGDVFFLSVLLSVCLSVCLSTHYLHLLGVWPRLGSHPWKLTAGVLTIFLNIHGTLLNTSLKFFKFCQELFYFFSYCLRFLTDPRMSIWKKGNLRHGRWWQWKMRN